MRPAPLLALLPILALGCDPSRNVGTFSFGEAQSLVAVDPAGTKVPPINLLDKDGVPMVMPETLSYTMDPPGLAKFQNGVITPLKKGEGVLTAKFGPKGPTASLSIVSRPLDAIGVRCPEDPCVVKPAESLTLEARPSSGGDEVDKVKVKWESADPEIAEVDETGKVSAKKAGRVMIRATAFGVTGTGEVVVRAPTDTLEVYCPWPPFHVKATTGTPANAEDLPGGCEVRVGSPVQLTVVTQAGGEVVTDRELSYVSSQPQVMEIVNGELAGMQPGAGVVQVSVEDLRLSIPVEVKKAEYKFTFQGRRCTGDQNKVIEVGKYKFSCVNKKFGEKCMRRASGFLTQERSYELATGFMETLAAPCCCAPAE
jgi:hypothetical protein